MIYLGTLTYLSWTFSKTTGVQDNLFTDIMLIAFPVYLLLFGIYKTWWSKKRV
jgi:lipopolysaccharide export LptBFGC system permease protein LptF